jgi:hypothetical protein
LIDESERILGFEVPLLLKLLCLQIGNGGFGPGYGLLDLLTGANDDLGDNAVAAESNLRQDVNS